MGSDYAILYLEVNIVSLVLIGIILKKTTGLSKMVAQRNFAMSIIAEMVFFASDTIFVMINEGALPLGDFNGIAKLICKETYFFATAVMCYFWFIYFEFLRGTEFVKEKSLIMYASFIMWVMGILLVINLFNGFLFAVEPDGTYHRGPGFILTYIIPYTYVFVAFLRAHHQLMDKSFTGDRHSLRLITLFPIAPGIAGVFQFFFPRMPFACGVMALTTLILYLSWIDQLISLDPLTGLNNRKQLSFYYDHWVKNHNDGERMYVLMIDANKFKSINDTYGHIMGDNALKNIAESLKLGCRILPKRANIARYVGDEFAVLFESNTEENAKLLKSSISDNLRVINERTKLPFDLSVSIGYASTDGDDTLKELIDKADEAMYEAKKASK